MKWNEKQQEQVTMKVDEPNTPFVRYDAVSDKVTNWQGKGVYLYIHRKHIGKTYNKKDLPASLRNANEIPEDDDFALDSEPTVAMKESSKMDRWDLEDETEEKEKQSKGKKKMHISFIFYSHSHYYSRAKA